MTHLPEADPRTARIYRIAAGISGAALVIFGLLGFTVTDGLPFAGREGAVLLGLTVNNALNTVSILMGLVLIYGAVKGGALASTVDLIAGSFFLLASLVGLAVLRTDLNLFAYTMTDIIFSMVLGMVLLTFGLYGRATGGHGETDPTTPSHGDDARQSAS